MTPSNVLTGNGAPAADATLQCPDDAAAHEILSLKKGDVDPAGNKVKLIHARDPAGRYVIYETTDGRLHTRGASVSIADPHVNTLILQIADLTTHSPGLKKRYISIQAFALKTLFDGNTDGARKQFKNIYDGIQRSLMRQAKITYLGGAAAMMALTLAAVTALWGVGITQVVNVRYLAAIAFASMGGLFSVAGGTRALKVDMQDSRLINFLYGALRIVIAIIAGVIVCFLIEAKIILSFLGESSELSAFIIAAFLSGFSEMFVPNVLQHLEEQGNEK